MNDRAWLATRKGLLELRLRAGRWQIEHTHFLGDPVSMVLPPMQGGTHPGRLLAALNLGHFGVKLQASDDGGRQWQELPAPAYPPQPPEATGPAWKLGLVWALEAAHGTVWAGTLPGGLFRSADGGASWQLLESLWNRPERSEWFGGGYDAPGIHSVCPHPQRPGEVLVGVSCGGVWLTQDDGASWALRTQGLRADYLPPELAESGAGQDPHCIVRCPAAPEVLWCQHHGGIWRSDDGAALWQEVQAPLSNFGFAVAAHPTEPGTAWFAPAVSDQCRVPVGGALVVNRTRDAGASFDTLGAGLPGADCFDLVYRHGLAVADDGRSLLMGSTTGGLWASADAGEHWATVSTTLPPIYAVRFG
jgi:hypothetical protein